MAGNDFTIGNMPLHAPHLHSRAITAENVRGGKGAGGQARNGRKGEPCLRQLAKDMVFTFAEIEGPGCIRHIWITVEGQTPHKMRNLILRMYWDGQATPSVEAPLGDFFGVAHGLRRNTESAFLATPEGRGFNCWFPMPFAKGAKLTIANESGADANMFFYQVDYTAGDAVDADTPRFHAQFRRTPQTTMCEDHAILDGVEGRGRFLGCNVGIVDHVDHPLIWFGEGEVKMYIDGDGEYPTICGTGTEDYAGSGWGMGEFQCRQLGCPVRTWKYIAFYRWHETDPVYFHRDIRVTIQQMGSDGSVDRAPESGPLGEFIRAGKYRKDYLGDGCFERVDDVCSTAYWYQTLPTLPFPAFPDRDVRSLDLPPHNLRNDGRAIE